MQTGSMLSSCRLKKEAALHLARIYDEETIEGRRQEKGQSTLTRRGATILERICKEISQ